MKLLFEKLLSIPSTRKFTVNALNDTIKFSFPFWSLKILFCGLRIANIFRKYSIIQKINILEYV